MTRVILQWIFSTCILNCTDFFFLCKFLLFFHKGGGVSNRINVLLSVGDSFFNCIKYSNLPIFVTS